MSSYSEMMDLKQGISTATQHIQTLKNQIKSANVDYSKAIQRKEVAQSKYDFHVNNWKHMKNVADLVDLHEYRECCFQVAEAMDELSSVKYQMVVFDRNRNTLMVNLTKVEDSLKLMQNELNKYGELIPFPGVYNETQDSL